MVEYSQPYFAKQMFMLYLIISANFLAQIYSCDIQELLQKSMLVKHVLGFLTVFFAIVLVDAENKEPPYKKLLKTCVIYCLFLLSSRCDFYMLMIVLLCLFIVYFINQYRQQLPPEEEQTRHHLHRYEVILEICIVFLIVTGFLMYLGQKAREYENKWSWETFFVGVPKCKFNNIPKSKVRTPLKDIVYGVKRLVK